MKLTFLFKKAGVSEADSLTVTANYKLLPLSHMQLFVCTTYLSLLKTKFSVCKF